MPHRSPSAPPVRVPRGTTRARRRATPAATVAALIVMVGSSSGCGGSGVTAPVPREGRPDEFRLAYAGYGFGSHVLELRGDTVLVTRRSWERAQLQSEARTVPTATQWREFWVAVDAAGVARWPARCVDARIADGGGFSLVLAAGGRRFETATSNASPDASGACRLGGEETPEVRALLAAAGRLAGTSFP